MHVQGTRSFGPFVIDMEAGQLFRDGTVIPLRAKTWAVLCHFIENPGRLISKDELLMAVWQGGAVTDTIVNVSIAELRRALGESRREPQFIETVYRRGFRFIAAVERMLPPIPAVALGARVEARQVGTVLVGRDAELAEIGAFLSGVTQPARVLLISGEAGIGKSSLLEASLAGLAGDLAAGLTIGRGQCPPHFGQGYPFLPLIGALAELCRADAATAPLLQEHAPSWYARLRRSTGSAGAAGGGESPPDLAELVDFARAIGPLVLAFEDLHWADHATLDFITVLAGHPALQGCRVVGTFRPEDATAMRHPIVRMRRELLRYGQAVELSLPGLSERAVAEYISACFAGARCPDELAGALHARSAGNPLFLSVRVDHLKTAGALAHEDREVRPTPLYAGFAQAIPETLRDFVQQRCDERSEADRRLLGALSVVGLEADAATVAAALGDPVAETDAACDVLARNSTLVRRCGERTWPDGTVSGRYGFRHPLYQRVVYDAVPPAARAEAHRRVARALVAASGTESSMVAAVIADHFDRGNSVGEAIDYHVLAADDATERYATKDAIAHLHRALALQNAEPDPKREAQILRQLALTLPAVRGLTGTDFPALFARARSLHAEDNDAFEGAATLAWLVVANLMQGNAAAAESLAPELEEIATRHGTPAMRHLAAVAMGAVYYHQGNVVSTIEQVERDLGDTSTPVTLGPIDLRTALGALATVAFWQAGRPGDALAQAARAVEIASDNAHPFNLLIALQAEAIVQFWWGNFERAREVAQQLKEAADEQGVRDVTGVALMLRGCVECETESIAAGRTAIEASLEALRAHGDTMTFVLLLAIGAETLLRCGQREAAGTLLGEARRRIVAGEARYFEPEVDRLEGELMLMEGGPSAAEQAESRFRAAQRNAEQQGSHLLVLRSALSRARLWYSAGRTDEAIELVRSAANRIRGGDETREMVGAREFLARAGF